MSARILTEGLGKRYRVQRTDDRADDRALARAARLAFAPFEHLWQMLTPIPDDQAHWALRDVDLRIDDGDKVALIGRNGAGKTTLLKLLARLTAPTEGRAEVRGRIASMLELGTGFHRDLTGRENVYVNGQIQGMTRAEVTRHLDEIVDFAGVERYIDTPVRHYSSGMQIRLAMGVAVHLSAEILLIDEVLSVADVAFREKALARIDDVASSGRTVIFVSHNVNSILQLCDRAVLLAAGRVIEDGDAETIVRHYLAGTLEIHAGRSWPERLTAPGFADADPHAARVGADVVRLRAVRVLGADGAPREVVDVRDPLTIEVAFDVTERRFALAVSLVLGDAAGRPRMVTADNRDSPWATEPAPVGRHVARAQIPGDLLDEGRVEVEVRIETRPAEYRIVTHAAVAFEVTDAGDAGGVRGDWVGRYPAAALRPRVPWQTERIGDLAD